MVAKTIVYTANFHGYDTLRPIHLPEGWEARCYTSNPKLKCEGWNMVYMDIQSPILSARYVKIMGPQDADRYIWMDANLEFKGKWEDLPTGFVAMKHNLRDCAYDEGNACIEKGKDTFQNVALTTKHLLDNGYPRHNGLHATGFLIRENSEEQRAFNIEWNRLVATLSHRDQLTFDFVRWMRRAKVEAIPFLQDIIKYKHAR